MVNGLIPESLHAQNNVPSVLHSLNLSTASAFSSDPFVSSWSRKLREEIRSVLATSRQQFSSTVARRFHESLGHLTPSTTLEESCQPKTRYQSATSRRRRFPSVILRYDVESWTS
eukprot:1291766-Rhodomonas_salina.1